jgi:hypothetical protein
MTAILLWAHLAVAMQPPPFEAQLSALERQIAATPNDVDLRYKLLYQCYDPSGKPATPVVIATRRRHLFWMIEHHPEIEIFEHNEGIISPVGGLGDPVGFQQAEALWLRVIEQHADDDRVMRHAIQFVLLNDKPRAEDLLKRAQIRRPAPEWSAQLGFLYAVGIMGLNGFMMNLGPSDFDAKEVDGDFARHARRQLDETNDAGVLAQAGWILTAFGSMGKMNDLSGRWVFDDQLAERVLTRALAARPGDSRATAALTLLRQARQAMHPDPATWSTGAAEQLRKQEAELAASTSDATRLNLLFPAMENAFTAGDATKAARYAQELLDRVAVAHLSTTAYLVHPALLTLGRVALRAGDLAAAKRYLLASTDLPANARGDVALFEGFSPGMSLAKELLDRGEREVVLQYFERCRTRWPKGAGALARWKAMVEAGQTPDFPPALIR